MSDNSFESLAGDTTDADQGEAADELQAQLQLLEEENQRLRQAYAQQKQTEYQRAAIALGGVGIASLLAAVLFPSVRTVLVVVGAIGLFGGVITRYLTPERFVAADVGERVFSALAGNEAAVAAELGLQSQHVYVPVGEGDSSNVRLFVPEHQQHTVPAADELEQTFVITDDETTRGLAVTPTGEPLYREYDRSAVAPSDSDVRGVVEALAESIVETFEIADAVTTDVAATEGRVVVDVTGSVFGDGTEFDDPVVSLLAVGLAVTVGSAVRTEVAATEKGYTLTLHWDTEATSSDGPADSS